MSREPLPTPSDELRRTDTGVARPVRSGVVARLDFALEKLRARRFERRLCEATAEVSRLLAERRSWPDEAIARTLERDRHALVRARRVRNPVAERSALASACVVAGRVLGLEPHPGQLLGAIGLLDGRLMEIATGEGKTLALALASVPAALGGRAHVILTANDYLATRDAGTMGPLYARCGLRVGHVTSSSAPADRTANYARDVVYTTARELVADFLRDRLRCRGFEQGSRRLIRALLEKERSLLDGMVLRGIDSVFVDEADHALIDEAVTPLIISMQRRDPVLETVISEVFEFAKSLQPGRDLEVRSGSRAVELTAAARERMERAWSPNCPILHAPGRRSEWVLRALNALHLLHRDRDYIVRDGKVHIIDQTLGRILPNRTWSQGLHQFVELKEAVPLSPSTHTVSAISFQSFFRTIPRLAGVSGTLAENAFELHRTYGLSVVRVPLNTPCRRVIRKPRIFPNAEHKHGAAVDRIRTLHRSGRPVLVGTLSVRTSEQLARLLDEHSLPYRLLNAAQDHEEARVIARAGDPGAITLATNMAGRGVDIRPEPDTERLGGLCIVQLERNPARRVDRQLYGRTARQGGPGSVEIYSSLDEDVVAAGGWRMTRRLEHVAARVLATRFGHLASVMLIEYCQWFAERRSRRRRLAVLQRDEWIEDAIGPQA